MNYYKHHIGDYAKKTGHLTVLEHGAYLLMLHAYYSTEQPLPFGRDLYRICRANTKKERQAIDKIAHQFWTRSENGYINGRAFDEIDLALKLGEISRGNGKSGGRPKKPSGLSEKNRAGLISKPNAKALQDSTTPITTTPIEDKDSQRANSDVEKARAARSPATRLPDDFALTDIRRSIAESEHLDPQRTFVKFTNYWRAATGAKARKLDWDATWQNWCMTETDRNGGNGSGKRPGRRAKSVAELEAEEAARAEH